MVHYDILCNNSLVLGNNEANKISIVEKMLNIYRENNCEIEILSLNEKFNVEAKSISDIAETISNYQIEMSNRFKIMEQYIVNNISKVPGNYPTKILVVDDYDNLIINDDYKSVDTIRGALMSIATTSKAVNVFFILLSSSTDMSNCRLFSSIRNKILVGPTDEDTIKYLYGIGTVDPMLYEDLKSGQALILPDAQVQRLFI